MFFLNEDGTPFGRQNDIIIISLKESQELSTGVMRDRQNSSDLAFLASEKAIATAGIDPETIDYIILLTTLEM
jgi:3-oxoacyl-[acyl-carrier-protein] synthase-3